MECEFAPCVPSSTTTRHLYVQPRVRRVCSTGLLHLPRIWSAAVALVLQERHCVICFDIKPSVRGEGGREDVVVFWGG